MVGIEVVVVDASIAAPVVVDVDVEAKAAEVVEDD